MFKYSVKNFTVYEHHNCEFMGVTLRNEKETFFWNSLDQEWVHILILCFFRCFFHLSLVCSLGPVTHLFLLSLLLSVPTKSFCSVFIKQHRKHAVGAFLQKSFNRFSQGKWPKIWLKTGTRCYECIPILCFQHSWDTCYIRSFSTCWLFLANNYHSIHTHYP